MDTKLNQQVLDRKFAQYQETGIVAGDTKVPYLTDDMKDWYVSLCVTLVDMNGNLGNPGPITSYIPRRNYYQMISAGLADTLGDQSTTMEITLNYVALGKGISGFLGAAVRLGYRDHVDVKRECNTIDSMAVLTNSFSKADIKAVSGYMKSHAKAFRACRANVSSFLVQAGANLIRMTHHWSSESHKEYTSMIKVMGLEDTVPDDQLRSLVYLSVHPCPLVRLEVERTKERKEVNDLLIETVSKRKEATPSGYGAAGACFAAANNLLSEEFANPRYWQAMHEAARADEDLAQSEGRVLSKGLIMRLSESKACIEASASMVKAIKAFMTALGPVFRSPANYCVLAAAFGKERKTVDLAVHTGAMCMLTAYIYTKVRGTLSRSPALKKFRGEHSVRVTRAQEALEGFEGTGTLATAMAAV